MAATLPPARATITLSQARLGNVFLTTESVQIPLTCDGDEVAWTVKDFFGATVKQGSVTPVNSSASVVPALGRVGYFELLLTEKKDGSVLSTKETTLAVLTPFDASTLSATAPWGAQTHYAQYLSTQPLALLARAGIKHFRDDHYWAALESTRGVYTYPAPYTRFMQDAANAGLQPLLTLGWGNSLYDGGGCIVPYTESGREGFANYARSLVTQYGSQLKALEVWNEFNGGTYVDGPAKDNKPYYYTLLLKKVYETVKPVRPDVKIVAGATVPIAHGFLQNLFIQGAMPYLDVVSVHPYRGFAAGVDVELAELRELIKSYNNGVEKPIWASEFSLAIETKEQQYEGAAYLAQMIPLMLSQKVERMYYYLSTDDTVFPMRGLLATHDDPKGKHTPHPTFVAYATAIRQLTNARFEWRVANTSPSTYALKFLKGSAKLYPMWATQPVTVKIGATSNLTVTDLMGNARTITPVNGFVTLELDKHVQYISGDIKSFAEVNTTLFADSTAGYSKTQGLYGWFYGSATVPLGGTYSPALFLPMTWKMWNGDNYRWVGGSLNNFITVGQVHPTNAWAVRRWVSDKAGTVTLTGEASRVDGRGNGVYVRIFVDGREVYTRFLAPTEEITYEVPNVTITQGTIIDFVVDANGSYSYDSTRLTGLVTKQ